MVSDVVQNSDRHHATAGVWAARVQTVVAGCHIGTRPVTVGGVGRQQYSQPANFGWHRRHLASGEGHQALSQNSHKTESGYNSIPG